jgi:acyl-CoA hydrolase
LDPRPVRLSQVEMTELVLPNDANVHGNVLGGRVMHLVDICAAIAASRHCGSGVVTAAMDAMEFLHPVSVGHLLVLKASVNFAARTSMEVGVKVWSEDPHTRERRHTSSAFLTFVAVDRAGRPVEVPPVLPETDEEKHRFAEGERRRKARLEDRERRRARRTDPAAPAAPAAPARRARSGR